MPSTVRRKARKPAESHRDVSMRNQLTKAAFELFATRGFQNVNLDMVAKASGVTKGSLYWHFSSKKELVQAACSYYFRTWQQEAYAAMAIDTNPRKQLQRVLRMSVQKCLFDSDNRLFTSEIFAMSLQDAEIRSAWAQFYDTVRELYIGLVRAMTAQGLASVDDPRDNVDWMLAALEGIKQRASFEPEICDKRQLEVIADRLLQMATGEEYNINTRNA